MDIVHRHWHVIHESVLINLTCHVDNVPYREFVSVHNAQYSHIQIRTQRHFFAHAFGQAHATSLQGLHAYRAPALSRI